MMKILKLNNIMMLSCVFMGSCFTPSLERLYISNKYFEYCNSLDQSETVKSCEKLKCWKFWIKHCYNSSCQSYQRHSIKRIHDLYLTCPCRI